MSTKDKIFCANCKHFRYKEFDNWAGSGVHYRCGANPTIEDNWEKRRYILAKPNVKNADNNCSDFSPGKPTSFTDWESFDKYEAIESA